VSKAGSEDMRPEKLQMAVHGKLIARKGNLIGGYSDAICLVREATAGLGGRAMTHTQTDTETGENAVQVLEEQAVRAFDAYCAQIGRSELTDREIALLFRMLRAFAVGLEGGR
jgi:hypothetical protein